MLTEAQHRLLAFLASRAGGPTPSYEEMCRELGIKSKSGAHRLVLGLEERGYIRRMRYRARAIEIIRKPEAGPQSGVDACVARIIATGYRDPEAYEAAIDALADLASRNGVFLPGISRPVPFAAE